MSSQKMWASSNTMKHILVVLVEFLHHAQEALDIKTAITFIKPLQTGIKSHVTPHSAWQRPAEHWVPETTA